MLLFAELPRPRPQQLGCIAEGIAQAQIQLPQLPRSSSLAPLFTVLLPDAAGYSVGLPTEDYIKALIQQFRSRLSGSRAAQGELPLTRLLENCR